MFDTKKSYDLGIQPRFLLHFESRTNPALAIHLAMLFLIPGKYFLLVLWICFSGRIWLCDNNVFFSYRCITITFNVWTSKANESYLVVTGHFVAKDSDNVEAVVISLTNSTEIKHSDKEYCKKIEEDIFQKLKFDDHNVVIAYTTTNGASNMKKTASILQVKHMPCYAHTLQLILNDILYPSPKIQSELAKDFEFEIYKYVCIGLCNFKIMLSVYYRVF